MAPKGYPVKILVLLIYNLSIKSQLVNDDIVIDVYLSFLLEIKSFPRKCLKLSLVL